MKIDVTCSTDDKYVQHCCAMLCSLFENNKNHDITVHVPYIYLSEDGRDKIENVVKLYQQICKFYLLDASMFNDFSFRPNSRITLNAYYRMLLPTYIDESVEKILYLDCDMIVLGDVSELYELELKNFGLAACRDCMPYEELHRRQMQLEIDDRTFCTGIMLVNLKYWRENNSTAEMIRFAQWKRDVVFLEDQDAMNYVFRKHWFMLPYKWNKGAMSICAIDKNQHDFDYYEYVYEPKVIHYASVFKPWLKFYFPERHYYVKYLKKSGYPNPIFTEVNQQMRIKLLMMSCRYYINRYVHPFVPDILEILMKDVFRLIKLFCMPFAKTKQRRLFLISEWRKKYN